MNETIHYRHLSEVHRKALTTVGTSLVGLREIALSVIDGMPPDIHMVSGPMTTGGLGTIPENLAVLYRTVEWLGEHENLNIFSQFPFEEAMIAYHAVWAKTCRPGDYCWPILHDFYAYLFATRKIKKIHFIHGYRQSTGANWEHEQCDLWGIEKRYLPAKLATQLFEEVTGRKVA